MENNKEIIEKMIETGVSHLTILKGVAPTPPEKFNPKPVSISGAIDSPLRFLMEREDQIDHSRTHAIAKRGEKTICLVINEQSSTDKYTIIGTFKESKRFVDLNINKEVGSSPVKLSNTLKLLRSIFIERAEHALIVSTLRNLTAKVNRTIEEADDKRGNTKRNFEQTVESNMPKAFTLKMPLFEGEKAVEFQVSVTLEADGGDIVCFLESVEASEIMDAIVDERFDEQVKELQNTIVVIEA